MEGGKFTRRSKHEHVKAKPRAVSTVIVQLEHGSRNIWRREKEGEDSFSPRSKYPTLKYNAVWISMNQRFHLPQMCDTNDDAILLLHLFLLRKEKFWEMRKEQRFIFIKMDEGIYKDGNIEMWNIYRSLIKDDFAVENGKSRGEAEWESSLKKFAATKLDGNGNKHTAVWLIVAG